MLIFMSFLILVTLIIDGCVSQRRGWKRRCLTAFIRGNSTRPPWAQQSCCWGRPSIAMRRPPPSTLPSSRQGFFVSTGSGTGILDYQDGTYRLSVSSFGFGTIGVSGGELVGTAQNLRTVADIAGTYMAAAAGLRSAPADRWRGFRMRTVSSLNWLEHSLA